MIKIPAWKIWLLSFSDQNPRLKNLNSDFFRLGFRIQKNLWRESIYSKIFDWREVTTTKSLQRNPHQKSQKSNWVTLDQNTLKRNFIQNLWRESIYPKIFEEKSLPKNLCRKIRTQTFWRDIPAKKLERGISTKKSLKTFYQNLFEDNFSTKNCLKRNLFQTNFNRNLYQKSNGRNISTTKSLKKHLYTTIFTRNPY